MTGEHLFLRKPCVTNTDKLSTWRISFAAALTILYVFFSLNIHANQDSYPPTPEKVVEAFCNALFNGMGLSSQTSGEMLKYTILDAGPGWDHVIVVTSYNVKIAKLQSGAAQVKVMYDVVGELDATNEFVRKKTKQTVVFHLTKRDEKWKLTSLPVYPFISVETAMRELAPYQDEPSARRSLSNLKGLQKSVSHARTSDIRTYMDISNNLA